ncbi:hypothetical protein C8R48DRAFT_778467 [Suillus tomentosus]|nr:hypothetical protein C8R48DRAFT_778467 [Suillus tomentosus]
MSYNSNTSAAAATANQALIVLLTGSMKDFFGNPNCVDANLTNHGCQSTSVRMAIPTVRMSIHICADGDPNYEDGDPNYEDGDPNYEDGDPNYEDGDPNYADDDPNNFLCESSNTTISRHDPPHLSEIKESFDSQRRKESAT